MSHKPVVVISSPVDTYSGYGARSRDIVDALISLDKYDIKLLSQRWGNTKFGYLKDHGREDLVEKTVVGIDQQPDVWIQISVPNEFKKLGKYNIGITAGIETTLCHASWIEGLNNMDLNLVSSNHAKQVFETTKYRKEDNGKVIGTIELQTPIEVLFEGAKLDKYFPTKVKEGEIFENLNSIKESYAFLFVGHWLQGDLGHDRKNIKYLIKAFLETFKNKRNAPALILKTQMATSSIIDRETILKQIDAIRKTVGGTLPSIYLIYGELSDEQINELYNHDKVKSMLNFTKGEGFGRPLLEFSLTGKPIVASGWSGHTDFLDKEFTYLVGGQLHNVHPSAQVKDMILAESQWFQPNDGEVATSMKALIDNEKKFTELAKRQQYKSKTNFSFEAMTQQLDTILEDNLPQFAQRLELNLPILNI